MSADRKDLLLSGVTQQRDEALNRLANLAADAQMALNERDERIAELTKLNAEQATKIEELTPTSAAPSKKGLKSADSAV